MANEPGAVALKALDTILAQEPQPDQALFSKSLHCLSVFRDSLIERGVTGTRLEHVNAVISILMAGHFPLGSVPWPELHKARGWLAEAVKEAVLF